MPGARKEVDALVRELGEHTDEQPTLADLSRRTGYSPFHLHRQFTAVLGETPKQYVLRVRLERAAYLAAITNASFLSIALDVGFRSHATFTRAFRRRFARSPAEYRSAARTAQRARLARDSSVGGDGCRLSRVRAVRLAPAQLLASRHVGAYAHVRMAPFTDEDHLWRPLVEFARSMQLAHERTAWVMCLDDPTVTAGPQQRLDACIPVLGRTPQADPFALRAFAGGWYAGVEHVGHYDTIIQAYTSAADWVRRSKAYTFGTGTPVQVFRHVDPDPERHRTEVFLPIRRR